MEEIPKEEYELTDEELVHHYTICYNLLSVTVDPPDEALLIVLRYIGMVAQRKITDRLKINHERESLKVKPAREGNVSQD